MHEFFLCFSIYSLLVIFFVSPLTSFFVSSFTSLSLSLFLPLSLCLSLFLSLSLSLYHCFSLSFTHAFSFSSSLSRTHSLSLLQPLCLLLSFFHWHTLFLSLSLPDKSIIPFELTNCTMKLHNSSTNSWSNSCSVYQGPPRSYWIISCEKKSVLHT